MNLAVNEIFGPTFQGEGKNVGMPCVFLRLAGCNLACSWCDTRYAWDWDKYDVKAELHRYDIETVAQMLEKIQYGLTSLVISGGEPMLQHKAIAELRVRLRKWHVEIETAGTLIPFSSEIADQFTVSPKLSTSGNDLTKRYNGDALDWFSKTGKAVFKFVVCEEKDFEEIDTLVRLHRMQNVYIMPEGIDAGTINTGLQKLAHLAVERGYWISTRLQVQIYGHRRGV